MAQKQVYSQQITTFDYSSADQNTALFLALKLYDVTSGSAVLYNTTALTHIFNGTYFCNLTLPVVVSGHTFVSQISAYTDNTFATIASLAPASDTFIVDGIELNVGGAVR